MKSAQVVAYAVEQRTREIGIRMSLGAARYDVLKLLLGWALSMVALGVITGIVGSVAITRAQRIPLRHQADGPDHVLSCPTAAWDCCAAGELHPRTPGDEGRSHDCASLRIIRDIQGEPLKLTLLQWGLDAAGPSLN